MLTYSLEKNNWRNKCRNLTLFAPLEGNRSQAEDYKWKAAFPVNLLNYQKVKHSEAPISEMTFPPGSPALPRSLFFEGECLL